MWEEVVRIYSTSGVPNNFPPPQHTHTITFKNLINDATSHLTPLLCNSLTNKYMIIVRNVTNMIMKKKKKKSDKTN